MKRPSPLSALARGKVGVGEDLLTSVVLGRLSSLPGSLVRLLEAAQPFGDEPSAPRPTFVRVQELSLWPWWNHHPRLPGCEPDAELVAIDEAGASWLFAIEAKLDAGKSGSGLEDDQLMRQMASGPARAAEFAARFGGVLFLTGHSAIPLPDLAQSAAHCSSQGLPAPAFYWTNWATCHDLIARTRQGSSPLDQDLDAILHRIGQAAFAGVHFPAVPLRWSFNVSGPAPARSPDWRFSALGWVPPPAPPWRFTNDKAI